MMVLDERRVLMEMPAMAPAGPPSRDRPPRVAAVDLGKVRAGVAVADDLGMLAHARPFVDARSRKALLAALVELAREEAIGRFLVGLPLDLHGEHGPAARRALAFAQELSNATGLEVELVDERLTTVQASRRLREGGTSAREERSRIDGAAAAVLLQAWLDRNDERGAGEESCLDAVPGPEPDSRDRGAKQAARSKRREPGGGRRR
jgi:putative holliday junction resolvase